MHRRIVHYYPKAVREHSGVTYSMWNWAEALVRTAGCEALVIHAGGPFEHEYADLPVAQERLPHLGRDRRTFLPQGLGQRLRKGDVLVLHDGWVLSNIAAARAALSRGVPYVVVPHGAYEPSLLDTVKFPRVRGRLESFLLENAVAVHVFYEAEKALVARFAPRQQRFILAHNGVDPAPSAWVGGGGYLSWYGRLDVYHKGLDLVIRAVASLPTADRPRLRLHGYDYNGGLALLQRLIKEHEVDADVTIGPRVSGHQKWELIRYTDGYVHVSRWESASIALLEHMSAGVPMVVSDTTRLAEELGRGDFALTTSLEPHNIAAQLVSVTQRPAGESDRLRAYTLLNYSWNNVAAQYVSQLESALSSRAPY